MGYKVTLRPGEKFWVNGGFLSNGDRKSFIVVESNVRLLKGHMLEITADENSPEGTYLFVSLRDACTREDPCPPDAKEKLKAFCASHGLSEGHALRRAMLSIEQDLYTVVRALYKFLWSNDEPLLES